MSQAQIPIPEPTPVDDVRRIRERFSREAGGDIRTLVQQSQEFFEKHKHEFNLRIVAPPAPLPALQEPGGIK